MFNVSLVGADKLTARLDEMPAAMRASLLKVVHGLAINLQGYIVSQKLHGQVLSQRSGALARSIQEATEDTGTGVYGKVYSAGDVKYAGFWEFGYHGTETVREHTRTTVFGRTVEPFAVPSFTRRVDQAPRSFMRTSLAENREKIEKALLGAVVSAAQGRAA